MDVVHLCVFVCGCFWLVGEEEGGSCRVMSRQTSSCSTVLPEKILVHALETLPLYSRWSLEILLQDKEDIIYKWPEGGRLHLVMYVDVFGYKTINRHSSSPCSPLEGGYIYFSLSIQVSSGSLVVFL